jgi:hypothetical protein
MLPSMVLIDRIGNRVLFSDDNCHHVCFKPVENTYNQGERTEWNLVRAQRLLWIETALTNPTAIVTKGKSWYYLLEVEADLSTGAPGELYLAIANPLDATPEKRGDVHFCTAYTISVNQWHEYRKSRPWLYPPDQIKPKKTKAQYKREKRARSQAKGELEK